MLAAATEAAFDEVELLPPVLTTCEPGAANITSLSVWKVALLWGPVNACAALLCWPDWLDGAKMLVMLRSGETGKPVPPTMRLMALLSSEVSAARSLINMVRFPVCCL
jgi:hypothetical protein